MDRDQTLQRSRNYRAQVQDDIGREALANPGFIEVSPEGYIPGIRMELHEGRDEFKLHESLLVTEYIGEKFYHSLLPESPEDRAIARLWIAHIERKIISPFFAVLLSKDEESQKKSAQTLLNGLVTWSKAMAEISASGLFFGGDSKLTLVDIALLPWWQRLLVLLEHRGNVLNIPVEGDRSTEDAVAMQRAWDWWRHAKEIDSFKRTVVDWKRLTKAYSGYAENQ